MATRGVEVIDAIKAELTKIRVALTFVAVSPDLLARYTSLPTGATLETMRLRI